MLDGKVVKKMREISTEGLKLIGTGANGRVYRLNEEQIVKVGDAFMQGVDKVKLDF